MKRILFLTIILISSITAFAKAPNLEVEKLFDGRYNSNSSVTTTIYKNNGEYYRGMSISNNPDLIRIITNAISKDSAKAARFSEQTGEGGKYTSLRILNNGETINIGLQQKSGNAYFFIKGSEKAFK